jgi:hypothetical protein
MNNTTSTRDLSATMALIDEAITFLQGCDKPNTSEAATKFEVERSTPSKHFHGKRSCIAKANEKTQLITNNQETTRFGLLKTGIEPFNPDQVLKIFDEKGGDHPGALVAEAVLSRHSSSCLDTPSAQRTIRRIVNEAVAERDAKTEKVIRKLGDACVTLSAKLRLAKDREKGYVEALDDEKKKKKRERPFTKEIRAKEGVGMLFFSPSKVQKAREL